MANHRRHTISRLILLILLLLPACGQAATATVTYSPSPSTTPPTIDIPTSSTPVLAAATPTHSTATPTPTAITEQALPEAPPIMNGIVRTINSTVLPPTAPTSPLGNIAFADDTHGWMIRWEFDRQAKTSKQAIWNTTNGGRGWRKQLMGERISSFDAVSATTAWTILDNALLHTSDGGQSWQRTTLADEEPLFWVDFADPQHGWAINRTALFRTADGGTRWEKLSQPNPCATYEGAGRLSFVTATTGWALCSFGGAGGSTPKVLLQTRDGGASWSVLTRTDRGASTPGGLPLASGTYDFFFIDETRGWYGGLYGVLSTRDGGQTWSPIRLPGESSQRGAQSFRPIDFVTTQHGFTALLGQTAILLETTDGGATWSPIYSDPLWPEQSITFVSRTTGFGVGTPLDRGAILKTTDGGATWQQVGTLGNEVDEYTRLYFTDQDYGWAPFNRIGGPNSPSPLLFHHTTDGGRSWRLLTPSFPSQFSPVVGGQLALVDRQTGYLSVSTEQQGALYVTHDGGRTFQPVAVFHAPILNLSFRTAEIGWIITGVANGPTYLIATSDAGRTWRALPRNFQLPAGAGPPPGNLPTWYSVSNLSQFSATGAWVIIFWYHPVQPVSMLLQTTDSGTTWTRYLFPNLFGGSPQFIDPEHGWLVTSETLYRTEDGGKSWLTLR